MKDSMNEDAMFIKNQDNKWNYSHTGIEVETTFQWRPSLLFNADEYINIFSLDCRGN